jgi:phosphotriesterase-related protein
MNVSAAEVMTMQWVAPSARLTRREAMRLLGVGAVSGLIPTLRAGSLAEAARQIAPGGRPLPGLPPGAVIRTVLRDVSPDVVGKGVTLFHEHLSTASWRLPPPRPKNFREDVDLISEEVKAAAADGVSCIVDCSHPEMGRRLDQLQEIERRTGVLVVGCAGHYTQLSYPPEIARMSEDQLVEEMVQQVHSEHLGAFGEIGTSLEITPDERKVLRAVGRAHLRTGVPIIGHTDNGKGAEKTALEQLDIYESVGVKPDRIVIGHLDGFDDPQLHAAVAKRGAFVGFDRVNSGGDAQRDAMRVRNIRKFLDAGYVNRLLIATDFANEKLIKRNGGPGYAMAWTVFVPRLRAAGVTEEILRQVMYDNPRRLLAFVPKPA